MNLQQAIARNRRRQARFRRAERVLRRIRQRIFDYEDESPSKLAKANKAMATCQRVLAPLWWAQRKAAEARKLHATPSVYEAGRAGVR
jgi:hypothetical protein